MFQNWLRRAKRRALRRIGDPELRARMKEALRGVGFQQ
jgi:hypothetical protein